jgi:hypothetical protein
MKKKIGATLNWKAIDSFPKKNRSLLLCVSDRKVHQIKCPNRFVLIYSLSMTDRRKRYDEYRDRDTNAHEDTMISS